jgi:hypothetical protein
MMAPYAVPKHVTDLLTSDVYISVNVMLLYKLIGKMLQPRTQSNAYRNAYDIR